MGCGRTGLKSKTPVENVGKHQQCLRAAPQQWGCTTASYLLPPFMVNAGFWHSPGGLCGGSQRRYPHIACICCMQATRVRAWGGGGGGCWLSHRVSWCPSVCLSPQRLPFSFLHVSLSPQEFPLTPNAYHCSKYGGAGLQQPAQRLQQDVPWVALLVLPALFHR